MKNKNKPRIYMYMLSEVSKPCGLDSVHQYAYPFLYLSIYLYIYIYLFIHLYNFYLSMDESNHYNQIITEAIDLYRVSTTSSTSPPLDVCLSVPVHEKAVWCTVHINLKKRDTRGGFGCW